MRNWFIKGKVSSVAGNVYSSVWKKSAALFFSIGCFSALAEKQPNILFVFADDWGWGDLSCHGHPLVRTPNLDRLAAEGIDFHNFTVANPVCSPSRTALMTGHFPARHKVHEHFHTHAENQRRGMPDWLSTDLVLMPRLLQQAGYRTAHYGKWHLTNSDCIPRAPLPTEYGYDDARVWNGPGRHVFEDSGIDPAMIKDYGNDFLTEAAVNHAMQFIRNGDRSKPFFINLWIHETHTPFSPTPETLSAYPGVDQPDKTYLSVITKADRHLGRLFDLIQELGLDEDTLILFSSDNGPEVPNPNPEQLTYYSRGDNGGMKGRKRSIFQGGVCVPFIVRWPGRVPAGKVDDQTTLSVVDMLPTLCSMAGAELPPGYAPDGEDMSAALFGKPLVRKKPLFWQWLGTHDFLDYYWPEAAVQEGDWKLYIDPSKTRVELYNLKTDRAEQNNLAGQNPEKRAELLSLLNEWVNELKGE